MVTYNQPAYAHRAKLVILENDQLCVRMLEGQQEWKIGRYDPGLPNSPDVTLTSRFVARQQGSLHEIDGQWFYVENPLSTNSAMHNGIRIPRSAIGKKQAILLKDGDTLRIGNYDNSVCLVFTTTTLSGTWKTLSLSREEKCGVRRIQSGEIEINHSVTSNDDYLIQFEDRQAWLVDHITMGKLFINGKRIHGKAALHEGDCIIFRGEPVYFLGNKLLYLCCKEADPAEKRVLLSANIQSKKVKVASEIPFVKRDKEILRNIRLDILEGTMVAILSVAGSGKTSLAWSLCGIDSKGIIGSIYYQGIDLLSGDDELHSTIRLVPESHIWKEETPSQVFQTAVRKHYGSSLDRDEKDAIVSSALTTLGLAESKNTPCVALNRMLRSLVHVGFEWLCGGKVLVGDNLSEGLRPEYAKKFTQKLKELVEQQGVTIIHLLYDLSDIEMYDQVIVLHKVDGVGRLAYSGPVSAALEHFHAKSFSELFSLLENDPEKYIID